MEVPSRLVQRAKQCESCDIHPCTCTNGGGRRFMRSPLGFSGRHVFDRALVAGAGVAGVGHLGLHFAVLACTVPHTYAPFDPDFEKFGTNILLPGPGDPYDPPVPVSALWEPTFVFQEVHVTEDDHTVTTWRSFIVDLSASLAALDVVPSFTSRIARNALMHGRTRRHSVEERTWAEPTGLYWIADGMDEDVTRVEAELDKRTFLARYSARAGFAAAEERLTARALLAPQPHWDDVDIEFGDDLLLPGVTLPLPHGGPTIIDRMVAGFRAELEAHAATAEASDLEQAEARGAQAAQHVLQSLRWSDTIGDRIDTSALTDMLGVTRQALAKRVSNGSILGLAGVGTTWYPTWQLDTEAKRIRPVVRLVIGAFRDRLDDIDPLTIAAWANRPQPEDLDGLTPADWIKDGREDDVVVRAAERAAGRLAA